MTQIDFLDGLGRELDRAAGRLIRDQRRSRMRALLAPTACVAVVAATAVAFWPSSPADPEREVATEPAAGQLHAMLGVLRRPETGADRTGPAREGRGVLAGVLERSGAFRLLATTEQGEGIVVADGRVGLPGGGLGPQAACVFYPSQRTEGGAVNCWSPTEIRNARAFAFSGPQLHGLAPDGVTAVFLDTIDDSRRLRVRNNVFRSAPTGSIVAVTLHDSQRRTVGLHLEGAASVPVVQVPEATLRSARELAGPGTADVPIPPGFHDRGGAAYAGHRAWCMWQRYWMAAVLAGDDAVAGQAARVLADAPGWPVLRRDPRPYEEAAFATAQPTPAAVARSVAQRCGRTGMPRPLTRRRR